jgi:MFS family permease
VLSLQNLALGLASGVVTKMEVAYFGNNSVMVVGVVRYDEKQPFHLEQYYSVWGFHTASTCSGVTGLFACVTVPFIGALSDSVGRKPLMLLSCCLDVLPFATLVATENMYVYSRNDEHKVYVVRPRLIGFCRFY